MNRLPMLFSALAFILLASPPCRAADTKITQANSAAAQKSGEIPQTFPPGPTAREFEQQPVMDGGRLMQRLEKWPQAKTEKECRKMHGNWRRGHAGDSMICDLPAPDAGKICRDDSECTLYCKPDSHSAWGKDSLGSCETHTYFLGCIHGMVHGKPATGPCLD